jgi:biopolymer transport protein ExbB
MKKLFSLIAVFAMLSFGAVNYASAQEEQNADTTTVEQADSTQTEEVADTQETTETEEVVTTDTEETKPAADEPIHQVIKQKFIEGGAGFMSFVLIALILGLALVIERIIYLNLASTNTEKLLGNIEDAMNSGGIEAAKEVCRNTRGPVASIFYQGLDRYDANDSNSLEIVEKSVIAYGSVQMGLLEKGLSWISLFIALAPMLGFMGTVIGMIDAFDAIEAAGDIQPSLVAHGIKVALITTVSGLIVAMILQVFYNYIVSKIDGLVNDMEDASISLIDLVTKFSKK